MIRWYPFIIVLFLISEGSTVPLVASKRRAQDAASKKCDSGQS
jgi:hypothetical protein